MSTIAHAQREKRDVNGNSKNNNNVSDNKKTAADDNILLVQSIQITDKFGFNQEDTDALGADHKLYAGIGDDALTCLNGYGKYDCYRACLRLYWELSSGNIWKLIFGCLFILAIFRAHLFINALLHVAYFFISKIIFRHFSLIGTRFILFVHQGWTHVGASVFCLLCALQCSKQFYIIERAHKHHTWCTAHRYPTRFSKHCQTLRYNELTNELRTCGISSSKQTKECRSYNSNNSGKLQCCAYCGGGTSGSNKLATEKICISPRTFSMPHPRNGISGSGSTLIVRLCNSMVLRQR